MQKYVFFNDNIDLYAQMLKDIAHAKKYVFLETYIFDNDNIGKKFKKILLEKAKTGVNVKILVDGIGSKANKKFFSDIVEADGDVRIFKEFEWNFRIVKHNNSRDHRKLLVIDDETAYIGSSNITSISFVWREANLRVSGELAPLFRRAFIENFKLFNRKFSLFHERILPLKCNGFEIIRDVPSIKFRYTRKKQLSMIRNAKSEIMIEAAYFLPDIRFRKILKDASKRKVKITVIVPKYSDVRIVDLLREKYLGDFHKHGINIMLHLSEVLHSKLMIVDRKYFIVGSSNIDHRSSALQFEINLFGSNHHIVKKLTDHFHQTLLDCEAFDYRKWEKRSWIQKIVEKLLSTIRYSL